MATRTPDLDLQAAITIKDEATERLQAFREEIQKTKQEIKELGGLKIDIPRATVQQQPQSGGGGTGGGGLGAFGSLAGGAAAGVGLTSSLMTGLISLAHQFTKALSLVVKPLSDIYQAVNAIYLSLTNVSRGILGIFPKINGLSDEVKKRFSEISKNLGDIFNQTVDDMDTARDTATKVLSDIHKGINKLSDAQENVKQKTAATNNELKKTSSSKIEKVKSKIDQAATSSTTWFKSLLEVKNVLAGIAAFALTKIIKDISKVGMVFENFEARLETIVGLDESSMALAHIVDLAAKLPTTIDQTTEAYIRMMSLGIIPTTERMLAFGNLSALVGNDIQRTADAVAQAMVGEFEMLKAFGIRSRVEGEQVSFTFKGVEKTVAKSGTAILGYLEEIGKVEFAGGAARQMETLSGKISNLDDAILQLKNNLAKSGINDLIKDIVIGISNIITDINNNWQQISIFGVAMVGVIAKVFLSLSHLSERLVFELTGNVKRFFVNTQGLINDLISGLNYVNRAIGVSEIKMREWVDASYDHIAARQALVDSQKEAIKTQEAALDLWVEEINANSNGANAAERYNHILKKRDKESQSAAEKQANLAKQIEATKKAQEALNKAMDRGRAITESLRNPTEVYHDTANELLNLFERGFITLETYNRGLEKALDTLNQTHTEFNEQWAKGASISNEVMTPLENYKVLVDELNQLLELGAISQDTYNKKIIQLKNDASGGIAEYILTDSDKINKFYMDLEASLNAGVITWDQYTKAVQKKMEETADKAEESSDSISQFFVQAARNMQSAMSDFFFDAMQGKMSDFGANFKKMVDRMVADLLASQLMNMIAGDFGTGKKGDGIQVGGLIGLLAREKGGPVPAGTPTIVGERRAEVIVPQRNSYVYPSIGAFNDAMSSGAANESYHISINAVDSRSFRDMIERDDRWLVDAIGNAKQKYNKR